MKVIKKENKKSTTGSHVQKPIAGAGPCTIPNCSCSNFQYNGQTGIYGSRMCVCDHWENEHLGKRA